METFKIGRIPGKQVIVVKMENRNEKMAVMRNKNRLKGTKIYIENDLTLKEKHIQDKL